MAQRLSLNNEEGISTKGYLFKKGRFPWFRQSDTRCVVQQSPKVIITYVGNGHESVFTRRQSNELWYKVNNGGGLVILNTEGEITFRREKMKEYHADLASFRIKEADESRIIPVDPQEIIITYTPNLKDALFTGDKLELNVRGSLGNNDLRQLEKICRKFATKNIQGNFDSAYTLQKYS